MWLVSRRRRIELPVPVFPTQRISQSQIINLHFFIYRTTCQHLKQHAWHKLHTTSCWQGSSITLRYSMQNSESSHSQNSRNTFSQHWLHVIISITKAARRDSRCTKQHTSFVYIERLMTARYEIPRGWRDEGRRVGEGWRFERIKTK